MPSRSWIVLQRAVASALTALLLAGVLLPGAALAGPGTPPAPQPDLIETLEDVPATGNVLTNDLNAGDGTLYVLSFVALAPAIGSLSIAANGDYTFTPATGWVGETTTTYAAANDKHDRPATITIRVTELDEPPVADDDTVAVSEDATAADLTDDVLANDSDPDGDALAITGVSNVSGGQAGLTGGVLTFTPDADACGDGSGAFDYTVTAGGLTDSATVTVDVSCENDAPVAVDDDASGTEDTDVVIDAADLLADDTDTEGDTLTVTGVDNASGGSVALDGTTITFTPDADLCGDDAASFDYTVDDGNGGTATGTATIDLTCVNDDPVADDDTLSGTEDADVVATEGDLTANDDDADGDSLTVTSVGNATGGTVSLDAGTITFTPDAAGCGTAYGSFDYDVTDGTGTDGGHVTVDIECENDAPVAVDDDASGTEDADVVIDAADLLADDTDVDDDTLSVSAVDGATGGTVVLDGTTITFTPAADLCGDDAASFAYTVSDGSGGTDMGNVTIDLSCENDAPVAVDDTATIDESSAAADHDVIDDDTDTEGAELTLESVDVDAAEGTASIVGNKVRFTPAADFTGTATVTYVVTDGTDDDTGELVITVNAVDDGDVTAPAVSAASVAFARGRVDQTAPVLVSWAATDGETGVTGYEVELSVNGGAFHAFYAGTATSKKTYVPLNRKVVFRVRATDGEGNTSGWMTSATRRVSAIQNQSRRVDYSGTWRYVAEPRSSGGGYAYTTQGGASARATFTGSSVRYVAPKTPRSGKVRVFIDGASIGTFNLERSNVRFGRIIAGMTWSTSGSHRIRIVAVDAGARTNLDAFVVLR